MTTNDVPDRQRGLLAAQAEIDQLRTALETSRTIGKAIGILMTVHKIRDDEAFDMLRRKSQHLNRKLRDIAERVVLTGELPPG